MEILVIVLCGIAVLILVVSFLFSRTYAEMRGRRRRRDGVTPGMWPAATPARAHRHEDDSLDTGADGFDDGDDGDGGGGIGHH